ncbi:ABC transporter ATP-binding protein [Pseudonocardia ammonioxydans]|uniref:ABC transporter ATP-binding protein n=1 Tax=Pseudonocardia ammonioxydans TaxID=260086 RepID=UPI000B89E1DF|nr:ABC transporter ATP-binding protein [Pseudonocardia ammonioxydans]
MSKLRTERIRFAYEETTVLADLSVDVPQGRITSIVGPNGCGKSTLLRAMARLLKPRSGTVYLDGEAIANLATREVAKRLGVLPQDPRAPEGLTVRELASQGRYPHQSFLRQWSKSDERAVARSLEITGVDEFADRSLDTLSGGQRQRAWISMALAQETDTLLLDEPTTYLDMGHQLEVLELLARLNREEKQTSVMVLHDLNSAARYSHHMIALCEGAVHTAGPPHEVVTPRVIRDIFGVEADIIYDRRNGSPQCLPYQLLRAAED